MEAKQILFPSKQSNESDDLSGNELDDRGGNESDDLSGNDLSDDEEELSSDDSPPPAPKPRSQRLQKTPTSLKGYEKPNLVRHRSQNKWENKILEKSKRIQT